MSGGLPLGPVGLRSQRLRGRCGRQGGSFLYYRGRRDRRDGDRRRRRGLSTRRYRGRRRSRLDRALRLDIRRRLEHFHLGGGRGERRRDRWGRGRRWGRGCRAGRRGRGSCRHRARGLLNSGSRRFGGRRFCGRNGFNGGRCGDSYGCRLSGRGRWGDFDGRRRRRWRRDRSHDVAMVRRRRHGDVRGGRWRGGRNVHTGGGGVLRSFRLVDECVAITWL